MSTGFTQEPRTMPRPEMTRVVKDALQRHYGAMKVAALAMEIDQAQLTRELDNGKFKFERLELLDAEGRAAVVTALHEAYAAPASPRARMARLTLEIAERLNELATLAAGVA